MSQPVKLSDALVLDARVTGDQSERSIAGQIEFWARLGRAVEPLLSGEQLLALRAKGDALPLSHLLASVDSSIGRQRVADYLGRQSYPHYELAPGKSGLLVRIDKNGERTLGRFVQRKFVPVTSRATKPPASRGRKRRR